MSYEIIQTADSDVMKFLHITSVIYKKWKVWRVQFHDGKETFLYRCGKEWVHWSKDYLDKPALQAVGECVEAIVIRKHLKGIFELPIN
ncbi:hypothetical protein [Mucilaginibacter sp. FT3.2]|uniref:hypothetical protein n=1 Tax=Mucilaginibacter sp. FT3.2 TaxID=2723090 RepID=UPI00161A8BE1|nr:hypothetical protein [Mucilaginibacter sp. FT3.2]MBB6233716.1 hypothetical protein [Mucilaginibacter sp. FT3.2]